MALKYDYEDILEVDSETYAAWIPRIQVVEDASIQQAIQLGGTGEGQNTESYCKYSVMLELNGDQLTSGLLTFYEKKLASLEEGFRYGLN